MEDVIFLLKVLFYANKYVCVSDRKYNYNQRADSLSHEGHKKHCNYMETFCQILFTVEETLQEIRQTTQVTREQEKAIYGFFLRGSLFQVNRMFEKNREEAEEELAKELRATFGKSAIYIESLLNLMLKPKKQ